MVLAVHTIEGWIEEREHHYVCVTGVHGIMESRRQADVRKIHNAAGLVTPDGMPLVWFSRLSGFSHVKRVYGPDLMLECCRRSVSRGYSHFLYGGQDGVPEILAQSLRARFPGISIAGTYSPPFRPLTREEDADVVRMIDSSGADYVWVGLSTPKQERWMNDHVARIQAPVMLGVGAAFDFHAGLKRQAPRWMQQGGLEWFFRLLTEPRRLWRRYSVNIPLFLWNVALQASGAKRFDEITP